MARRARQLSPSETCFSLFPEDELPINQMRRAVYFIGVSLWKGTTGDSIRLVDKRRGCDRG